MDIGSAGSTVWECSRCEHLNDANTIRCPQCGMLNPNATPEELTRLKQEKVSFGSIILSLDWTINGLPFFVLSFAIFIIFGIVWLICLSNLKTARTEYNIYKSACVPLPYEMINNRPTGAPCSYYLAQATIRSKGSKTWFECILPDGRKQDINVVKSYAIDGISDLAELEYRHATIMSVYFKNEKYKTQDNPFFDYDKELNASRLWGGFTLLMLLLSSISLYFVIKNMKPSEPEVSIKIDPKQNPPKRNQVDYDKYYDDPDERDPYLL